MLYFKLGLATLMWPAPFYCGHFIEKVLQKLKLSWR
jgi:hypothetical protein